MLCPQPAVLPSQFIQLHFLPVFFKNKEMSSMKSQLYFNVRSDDVFQVYNDVSFVADWGGH